ncbi:hypothetical protein B0H17DRAFT_858058, partial [Mycena rosella]
TPPPVSSDAPRGSYQHDLASGEYPLSWSSLPAMEAWIRNEESANTIELRLKEGSHSHPIGSQNLIYTRIPVATLLQIERDLRDGIRPEVVVRPFSPRARGGVHSEQNLPGLLSQAPWREEFIKQRDVHHIKKKIKAETIRLDPQDGRS